MASKFESARTEDWRSLAEANRLAQLPGPAERQLALEGKGIGRRVRQQDEDTRPNVFGARNLAIVAALLAAGYYIDGVLSGTRLDGSKGGPFRRMLDGSPAAVGERWSRRKGREGRVEGAVSRGDGAVGCGEAESVWWEEEEEEGWEEEVRDKKKR